MTPLIDGKAYLENVSQILAGSGAGDHFNLAVWRVTPEETRARPTDTMPSAITSEVHVGIFKVGAELTHEARTTKLACAVDIEFPKSILPKGVYRGVRSGLARSSRLHA